MKFDVVVGNPPYQDSNKKGSYNKIWPNFIIFGHAALKNGGKMAMITPQTWFTQPRINSGNAIAKVAKLIEDHSSYIQTKNIDRYFNVGSTFSYYILDKKISTKTNLNGSAICNNEIFHNLKDDTEILIEKIIKRGCFEKVTNSACKGNINQTKTKKFKYPVLISQKRVDFSDKPSKFHESKKAIFLIRTAYNLPVFDYAGDLSPPPGSTAAVYTFEDQAQLSNFEKLFDKKLFKFLISKQRKHHGFLSAKTVSSIPLVDLDKTWTDEELYAHFGLTADEIVLVEASTK